MAISFARAFNLAGIGAYVAELTENHVTMAKSRGLAVITFASSLDESNPEYVKVTQLYGIHNLTHIIRTGLYCIVDSNVVDATLDSFYSAAFSLF
jgi:hypothetical protein